jgi:hypothetical protein
MAQVYRDPVPLRDVLAELVAELGERLRRREGVRYLIARALDLRDAGAEGFRDVSPLDLACELLPLGDYPDEVLDELYRASARGDRQ